ncbi:hypothetical protein CEXT_552821 [Caerostris extrusa]|uniref:Uncharacterized protein n=1 Tax=Caerostris extrusa TaxID=172846 RepID=A0AAV4QDK7_CAEEX|nr:hypothetical protein CEXT_552821 [Caerostris extrusa]
MYQNKARATPNGIPHRFIPDESAPLTASLLLRCASQFLPTSSAVSYYSSTELCIAFYTHSLKGRGQILCEQREHRASNEIRQFLINGEKGDGVDWIDISVRLKTIKKGGVTLEAILLFKKFQTIKISTNDVICHWAYFLKKYV